MTQEIQDVTIPRKGDDVGAVTARRIISMARNEGFDLYVHPGQNQVKVRHFSQLRNQPSDGTDAGNRAKMAAEQYSGPLRQMSPQLSSAINNNRVALGRVLGAQHAMVEALKVTPPPAPTEKVINQPGYGGPVQTEGEVK